MMRPKNIILDLGGVLLNINYQITEKAFYDLGITNFKQLYAQHHTIKLFQDLETGNITEKKFYEQIRIIANQKDLTDENIEKAWNAMLLDFPVQRIEWLKEYKNKFNLFLFSNTNQIHYRAFSEKFIQASKGIPISDFFIKDYYSHKMGTRKPDDAGFLHILEEQQLKKDETLFIDDTVENIKTAEAIGLQTFLMTHPIKLEQLSF